MISWHHLRQHQRSSRLMSATVSPVASCGTSDLVHQAASDRFEMFVLGRQRPQGHTRIRQRQGHDEEIIGNLLQNQRSRRRGHGEAARRFPPLRLGISLWNSCSSASSGSDDMASFAMGVRTLGCCLQWLWIRGAISIRMVHHGMRKIRNQSEDCGI